jgi:hypothetical protein
MADTITVGRIVRFFDTNGAEKAAVITAIRDLAAAQVRLTVLEPGATLTDVDNVQRKNPPTPSSWQFLDDPRYG